MASDGHRSPPPRRARLARLLRHLRDEKRLTIETAARRADWSTSKLSRIETSLTGVAPADVAILLDVYQVTGAKRHALITMARDAQLLNPRRISDAHLYAELESEVQMLFSYEPLLIPGIFQIPEYIRALLQASDPDRPSEQVEQSVGVRLARQALLTRADAPQFHFMLDQAALSRAVGGPDVMGVQLRRLAEHAQLPNVTLQVISFESGAHTAMNGMFAVFEFSGEFDPGVVYLERMRGGSYLDEPSDVEQYIAAFRRLSIQALDPDASVRLIRRLAIGHAGPGDTS